MMQNMKPLQIILFLFVLAGLASCTGKPNQFPTIPPTPQVSSAAPTLAAPTLAATREVTTERIDGSENAAACDGIVDNGITEDGWKIYCNSELSYTFHYPADASLEVDQDHPWDGVSLIGPESNGERWPWIEIRHPQGQAEYNPPADVDLHSGWQITIYSGLHSEPMCRSRGSAQFISVLIAASSPMPLIASSLLGQASFT